jgi:cystathionine beta-lyase/cystathionine gamma-synthase
VERQMRTGGGMLTLELVGGLAAARRCFDRFTLIARAVSLGGFESCASLPVETSHTGCTPAELASAGVTEGMIRLSIGLEDVEDLWADLDQALGA